MIVERLQAEVLTALPLDELPGAGAHGGRLGERRIADLLDVAIPMTVLAINLVGDRLRDALDPRTV